MDELNYSAREYQTPILAAFCRITGSLTLLATVLFTMVAFRDKAPLPTLIVTPVVGVLASFVAFGIAQVIAYVAKIEYHTSSEKNEAILRSLHQIEGHLQAIRDTNQKA